MCLVRGACPGVQGTGKVWCEVAPAQLTPLSPLQMADSGGLPQVTQVRLLALPPSLTWPGVGEASPLPESQAAKQSMYLSLVLQPGKLTEAFKYFLQGMGYSKYTSTPPCPRDWGAGSKLGLTLCLGA